MADATINIPESDPIASIDLQAIHVFPYDTQIIVDLIYRRQSGVVAKQATERVDGAEFNACINSFCLSAPKKKLLTHLTTLGRLPGVTVS